ncbi:9760_t:CDS:2 [Dentiscutata erythropus]|uniref:9760_t:CDS:1 n=1 Tax=Dentiscutata erythropus TaxID=1348616 RepID=A0A9N9E902_9GLOM|nr:9760_t:CDS:2 [Dentiscutata erythropus]
MTLTRAQRAQRDKSNMRSSLSKEPNSKSTGISSSSTGKVINSVEPMKVDRLRYKQRRTRSGRKVADYHEPTSDSSEDEYFLNNNKDVSDRTRRKKLSKGDQRTRIQNTSEYINEQFHVSEHTTSSDGEQESSQEFGFPIFTKEFLAYDKERRCRQKKLEQENKSNDTFIESLRIKVHTLRSDDDRILRENQELEASNAQKIESFEKIKMSLIQLEREIGPTVRSSGVKLDDAENMIAYINDFRKRVVSGCLLQP